MNAAEVMTKDVVTAGPEVLVRDLAVLMLERRISGLPVVDAERHVLGVVSESDLIRRAEIETDQIPRRWLGLFVSNEERMHDFVKSHARKAQEVMTTPALCVAPQTPLAEIVRLMERHSVKRLPVVEDGRLAGIVSRADLLRAFLARPSVSPVPTDDHALREKIESLILGEGWAATAMVNVIVENGVAGLWGTVESAAQREALVLAVRGVPGVRAVEVHLGKSLDI